MTNDATLSAKDVCAIIKTCRQHGVSTFKFHELTLEFGYQSPKPAPQVATNAEDGDGDYEPDLDQMMVEDPVAYEKFLSEHMDEQKDS